MNRTSEPRELRKPQESGKTPKSAESSAQTASLERSELAERSKHADSSDLSVKSSSSRGNTITVTVLLFLIITFFMLTLGSQLMTRFSVELETEAALFYEGSDSILFQAVYFRDERHVEEELFAQIMRSGNGVISYTNRCGAKLSINSVIAVVYPNEEEKLMRRQITELQQQIEILIEAETFAGGGNSHDSAQVDAFAGQLEDVHARMLRSIAARNYERATAYSNQYLGLQTKINLLRGTVSQSDIAARINEFRRQISSLEGRLTAHPRELRVQDAGYFVSNADGHENSLTFAGALSITRAEIENVIANPVLAVADNVAGKMIDCYRWRMAAILPNSRTHGIARGQMTELRIGAFPRAVSAEVVRVADLGDGYSVFVFESEILNEEFVRQRVASVRLMLGRYSGIRLPQSAVVFNDDGERGVFVRNGAVLRFRRVNLIRSDDDFVIVESSDDEGFLRLFDDVVVGGTNLYDGKIV
jgi:putative membrane fusion protein